MAKKGDRSTELVCIACWTFAIFIFALLIAAIMGWLPGRFGIQEDWNTRQVHYVSSNVYNHISCTGDRRE